MVPQEYIDVCFIRPSTTWGRESEAGTWTAVLLRGVDPTSHKEKRSGEAVKIRRVVKVLAEDRSVRGSNRKASSFIPSLKRL
jgi:hypothetical protein